MNQSILKKFLLIVLLLAAIVSIYQGYSNAQKIDGSDDFQWSPAVLFLEGINPYMHQMDGNTDGRIILSQRPNYAHGLYVLLSPLALIEYKQATAAWAALGIIASLITLLLIGREFKLTPISLLICSLLFFCSTPFRNSIGNGQQSILAFFAFSLLFLQHKNIGSFLSGMSYFKYSFAPPIAFYILISRGWKALCFSLLPCLIGYLIFMWQIGGDPWSVLVQPLKVGMGPRAGWEGVGDLMTIFKMILAEDNNPTRGLLAYLLPIILSCLVIAKAVRNQTSIAFSFSVVCLSSLMFFSHRWYDHVFLLPLLAYAIANFKLREAKIITVIVMWNWFAMKILRYFLEVNGFGFDANLYLISLNFCLNAAMLICLFSMNTYINTHTKRFTSDGLG
jgi:hypothetical protein